MFFDILDRIDGQFFACVFTPHPDRPCAMCTFMGLPNSARKKTLILVASGGPENRSEKFFRMGSSLFSAISLLCAGRGTFLPTPKGGFFFLLYGFAQPPPPNPPKKKNPFFPKKPLFWGGQLSFDPEFA